MDYNPPPNREWPLSLKIVLLAVTLFSIISLSVSCNTYFYQHDQTCIVVQNCTYINNADTPSNNTSSNNTNQATPFSPTPTVASYPTIASTYQGVVHNTTYNLTATLTLTNILQNQSEFSGSLIVGTGTGTGLGGSGSINGAIQSNGAISFIDTIGDACCQSSVLTFVGTLHTDGSMSGTYTTNANEQGDWHVTPA